MPHAGQSTAAVPCITRTRRRIQYIAPTRTHRHDTLHRGGTGSRQTDPGSSTCRSCTWEYSASSPCSKHFRDLARHSNTGSWSPCSGWWSCHRVGCLRHGSSRRDLTGVGPPVTGVSRYDTPLQPCSNAMHGASVSRRGGGEWFPGPDSPALLYWQHREQTLTVLAAPVLVWAQMDPAGMCTNNRYGFQISQQMLHQVD